METRKLGSEGLEVSAEGLGCMGMSEFYGDGDEVEAIATIHRALELGVNFLDTADMYGPFTNEQLIGRAIAGRRDEVVLAVPREHPWAELREIPVEDFVATPLVQLDPGGQVAERLGVDDHPGVDRLAPLDPGHDADQGVLEDLGHTRITPGTSGARLTSWSM